MMEYVVGVVGPVHVENLVRVKMLSEQGVFVIAGFQPPRIELYYFEQGGPLEKNSWVQTSSMPGKILVHELVLSLSL